MTKLAVCQHKGGTCKSAVVASVASALAERQRRVLVVDLDPQGSIALAVGAEVRPGQTITEVLMDDLPLEEVVVATAAGFDLAPSDRELTVAAGDLQADRDRAWQYALADAIAAAPQDRWDDIIIDTPPTAGPLTVLALAAADGVVIPTTVDTASWDQVHEMIAAIARIRGAGTKRRAINDRLVLHGIIPTMTMPRTVLHRELMAIIEEEAAEAGIRLFEPVAYQVAAREAVACRRSILQHAPNSQAAAAYRALAAAIVPSEEPTRV